MCDTAKAEIDRSIAQPGSAPGLGPGGRRFESYCSDHILDFNKKIIPQISLELLTNVILLALCKVIGSE